MKKVVKIIAVGTLWLTTTLGLAKEPEMRITANDAVKSLILELDADESDSVLKMIDSEEHVIYSENINSQIVYRKKFDLSKLEMGTYTLVVESAIFAVFRTIIIDESGIMVAKKDYTPKPSFKESEKKTMFHLMNLDKEKVEITLYDSQRRIVFNETSTDLIVKKVFNFEKAYADDYTLVIKRSKEKFSKTILVE